MGRFRDWVRNWDGVQGYMTERSISARIGKHYCPYCNNLLHVRIKTHIVNSESEEANNFDFHTFGGNMIGNIKFNWDVFYCEYCNVEFAIRDIIRYERELKKTDENVDFDLFRERSKHLSGNGNKWMSFLKKILLVVVFVLILIMIAYFSS